MATHELKTWPAQFEAQSDGRKTFEIRYCLDRAFAVGDTLVLREFDPYEERYTGRMLTRVVTYLVNGGEWGLPVDLAVLSTAVASP